MPGLKRRQEVCGERVCSSEIPYVVEAELFPLSEGRMCAVAMRDGVAPPESETASRTQGRYRDPGGPAGSIGLVTDGGAAQGRTVVLR